MTYSSDTVTLKQTSYDYIFVFTSGAIWLASNHLFPAVPHYVFLLLVWPCFGHFSVLLFLSSSFVRNALTLMFLLYYLWEMEQSQPRQRQQHCPSRSFVVAKVHQQLGTTYPKQRQLYKQKRLPVSDKQFVSVLTSVCSVEMCCY